MTQTIYDVDDLVERDEVLDKNLISTCRCGFEEPCACPANPFYADWTVPPAPSSFPKLGLRAAGFRYGFALGGTDALRRVWPYVPPEHRGMVKVIAAAYVEEAA